MGLRTLRKKEEKKKKNSHTKKQMRHRKVDCLQTFGRGEGRRKVHSTYIIIRYRDDIHYMIIKSGKLHFSEC